MQSSTHQIQTTDDDTSAPDQRPRDHDMVGTSRHLEDPPQVSLNENGTAYFASPNNASQDGSIRLVRPQQIESPSVSIGSQPLNLGRSLQNGKVLLTQWARYPRLHRVFWTRGIISMAHRLLFRFLSKYIRRRHLSGYSDTSPGQAPAYPSSRPTQDRLLELLTSVPIARLGDYFLPPRALADHLLERYWDRVHCLYPFVHQQSFISSYECLWSTDSQSAERDSIIRVGLGGTECPVSVFHCALNAIFALGCQFSDLPSAERESLSETFFQRSKQLLYIDVLDEGV